MTAVLDCQQISKSYGVGSIQEKVLAEVNLNFTEGQASVLVGPSGSGKTTLLSILGCLLAPSQGRLLISGDAVDFSDKSSLTEVRRKRLGFIFQHAQLLPFMSIRDNLRIVGHNAGMANELVIQRTEHLLNRLGLESMGYKFPAQLSGGQRQRVAIARALIHQPAIVLADEPTAALDWHTGQTVVQLLLEQARLERAVLVVVTHDIRMLPLFDRVLTIEDGFVSEKHQHPVLESAIADIHNHPVDEDLRLDSDSMI